MLHYSRIALTLVMILTLTSVSALQFTQTTYTFDVSRSLQNVTLTINNTSPGTQNASGFINSNPSGINASFVLGETNLGAGQLGNLTLQVDTTMLYLSQYTLNVSVLNSSGASTDTALITFNLEPGINFTGAVNGRLTYNVTRGPSSVRALIENNYPFTVNISANVTGQTTDFPIDVVGSGTRFQLLQLDENETYNLTVGGFLSQVNVEQVNLSIAVYRSNTSTVLQSVNVTLNLPPLAGYDFSIDQSAIAITLGDTSNVTNICTDSTKSFVITNNGTGNISDMTFTVTGGLSILVKPLLNTFKLDAGNNITIIVEAQVNESTPSSNALINITGAGLSRTIAFNYSAPGPGWVAPPTLNNRVLLASAQSFICVNSPTYNVGLNYQEPLGALNITSAQYIGQFDDRCGSIQPHDTFFQLNGYQFASILDAAPLGTVQYSVPTNNISQTNTVTVTTNDYQGEGHFCANAQNTLRINVASVSSYCSKCEQSGNTETNFTDGIDNDCDGAGDCRDLDSCGNIACTGLNNDICPAPEIGSCSDGIDNDGNGLTDCGDIFACCGAAACSNAPGCRLFTGAVNVDSCRQITASGVYRLTTNVTSTGTCMNITADNVVFDCQGNKITFDTANQGDFLEEVWGIVSYYSDNVAVTNCVVEDLNGGEETFAIGALGNNQIHNWTGFNATYNTVRYNGTTRNTGVYLRYGSNSYIYGNTVIGNSTTGRIYGLWFENAGNVTANRNNITLKGDFQSSAIRNSLGVSGHNFQFERNYMNVYTIEDSAWGYEASGAGGRRNETFLHNIIYLNGTYGNYGISSISDNVTVVNNTIISLTRTDGSAYAIDTSSSDYGLIENNTIRTYGISGGGNVGIDPGRWHRVRFNNISTGDEGGWCCNNGIESVEANSVVEYNWINATGDDCCNYGIDVDGNNITVRHNIVYSSSSDESAGVLCLGFGPEKNQTIWNNSITIDSTLHTAVSAGIWLERIDHNYIYNNTIITRGNGSNYGIHMTQQGADPSSDNIIRGNVIRTDGTANSDGIRIEDGSTNNTFFDNNITVNDEGSYIIRLVDAGSSATLVNTAMRSRDWFRTASGTSLNMTNTTLFGTNGTLTFGGFVQVTGSADANQYSLVLDYNRTFVSSSIAPFFDIPARIVLTDLPFSEAVPVVDENDDGIYFQCSTCTNVSYENGTLSFNVTGFTGYAGVELGTANVPPSIQSIVLNSTNTVNNTDANLTLYLPIISNPSNRSIKNITRWIVNNNTVQDIMLPFETGSPSRLTYSVADFSGVAQGTENWYYYRAIPGQYDNYTELLFFSGGAWTVDGLTQNVSNEYLGVQSATVHPGGASFGDAVRAWNSTTTGIIQINSTLSDGDGNCGNGINYQIIQNDQIVFNQTLANGFTTTTIEEVISVATGDMIYFRTNSNGGNFDCDSTNEHITIRQPGTLTDYANGTTVTSVSAVFNATGGYDGFGAYEFDLSEYLLFPARDFGNEFSFTMWVKPEQLGFLQTLVANSVGGASTNGFRLFLNNETGRIQLETGNGATADDAVSYTSTVDWGQWQHIGVVVNRTAGLATFYHNGIDVSETNSIRTDFNNTAAWEIGQMFSSGINLNGMLDDFTIWGRALSASQVYALATNQTDIMVSDETEEQETWQACVTLNDGLIDSNETCSNQLYINYGHISTATSITTGVNATDGQSFTFSASISCQGTINCTNITATLDPIQLVANLTEPDIVHSVATDDEFIFATSDGIYGNSTNNGTYVYYKTNLSLFAFVPSEGHATDIWVDDELIAYVQWRDGAPLDQLVILNRTDLTTPFGQLHVETLDTNYGGRSVATDDKYVYVGGWSDVVTVFNRTTFAEIADLPAVSGRVVTDIDIYDGQVFAASQGCRVIIYDSSDLSTVATLAGPTGCSKTQTVDVSAERIYVGGQFSQNGDGWVQIFDRLGFQLVDEQNISAYGVSTLAAAGTDGQYYYVAGSNIQGEYSQNGGVMIELYQSNFSLSDTINFTGEHPKALECDESYLYAGMRDTGFGPGNGGQLALYNNSCTPKSLTIHSLIPANNAGLGQDSTCVAIINSTDTAVTNVTFNVTGPDNNTLVLPALQDGDTWTSFTFNPTQFGTHRCTVFGTDNQSNTVRGSATFNVGDPGVVPVGSGTPFYTTSPNPQTQGCLSTLAPGQTCNVSWDVVPTGGAGTWQFFVIFTGSQLNTSKVNITVQDAPLPPVPEFADFALMLVLGLVLGGFVAMRKRR